VKQQDQRKRSFILHVTQATFLTQAFSRTVPGLNRTYSLLAKQRELGRQSQLVQSAMTQKS